MYFFHLSLTLFFVVRTKQWCLLFAKGALRTGSGQELGSSFCRLVLRRLFFKRLRGVLFGEDGRGGNGQRQTGRWGQCVSTY